MKLKTLKDLEWGNVIAEGDISIKCVMIKDLKAGAIKYVKEINWNYCHDGKAIFMDFFNITEEDLK